MKREIKFRAWVTKFKWMAVQGSPDIETLSSFMNLYSDEENLMEYTGLKDINDKEIYEGDILKICNGSINGSTWMEKNRVVVFKNGSFNVPIWDFDSTHWIKIIGNIYDTPELL